MTKKISGKGDSITRNIKSDIFSCEISDYAYPMPVKEICRDGGMVDTLDSKSCAFAGVRVRVSLAAPKYFHTKK